MMEIAIGIMVGLLLILCVSLEELKTINREILNQLREKEKDDGIRTTNRGY